MRQVSLPALGDKMRLTDFIVILVALRDGGSVTYRSAFDDASDYACTASHQSGPSRDVSLQAIFRCQNARLIDVIRASNDADGYSYDYGLTPDGIKAAKTIDIDLDRALAKRRKRSSSSTMAS